MNTKRREALRVLVGQIATLSSEVRGIADDEVDEAGENDSVVESLDAAAISLDEAFSQLIEVIDAEEDAK